jgi:predicted ATPase
MYIEHLHVKNVRLLAEQEFSFLNADGSPRMWTVILGENGFCKSTLLQAVALAAMGPKLGTALIQDSQRLRNVESTEAASITAAFQSSNGTPSVVSSLRIEPERFDLIPGPNASGAEYLDEVRAHRRADWFIAGYGVGRFLAEPGDASLPKDPTVHRVQGLFNARHTMLGLGFYAALRNPRLAKIFSRMLSRIFESGETPEDRLLPGFLDLDLASRPKPPMFESSAFELSIADRHLRLPASWLSDGYQAMLSWIADLLGHAVLDLGKGADPEVLQGVVLLDEIDLHLHPTWQRRIVPILRRTFPKLQFVVTTHSPLVLAGFESEEIISLKINRGEVVQDPAGVEPGVLTASEILTNYFAVSHAGRPDLVAKERRYLELRALQVPSRRQAHELADLEGELRPYWSSSAITELLSPEEILKRKT